MNTLLTKGTFKKNHPMEKRLLESKRIVDKYPDRIPVILECSDKSLPKLDKQKYLIPKDLTIGQFSYVIRRRITLPSTQSMFLLINDKIMNTGTLIGGIYETEKDADNFLYVSIAGENTFG